MNLLRNARCLAYKDWRVWIGFVIMVVGISGLMGTFEGAFSRAISGAIGGAIFGLIMVNRTQFNILKNMPQKQLKEE